MKNQFSLIVIVWNDVIGYVKYRCVNSATAFMEKWEAFSQPTTQSNNVWEKFGKQKCEGPVVGNNAIMKMKINFF